MTPAGFYFDPQTVAGLKHADDQRQSLERVAQQFEALFVHMLLKQMREASFGDGLFDSQQSTFYRDMFDAQMAQHVGGRAGLGIAQLLVREFGRAMPVAPATEQPDAVADEAPAPATATVAPPPAAAPVAPMTAVTAPSTAPWPSDPRLTLVAASGFASRKPTAGQNARAGRFATEVVTPSVAQAQAQAVSYPQAPQYPEQKPSEVTGAMGLVPPSAKDWQSPQEFLALLQPYARKVEQALGVPSDVLLAQATLETGWGLKLPRHADGRNSFNLFGIKADARWSGEWVSKPTLEFAQGAMRQERAQFRAYPSAEASFQDYVSFLKADPRYAGALSVAQDPAAYLRALQDAGYATDPDYAHKILSLVDSERFRTALPDRRSSAQENSDDAV